MQAASLTGPRDDEITDWDRVSKQIDELRPFEAYSAGPTSVVEGNIPPPPTAVNAIAPTRSLTFDVLLYIVPFLDHWKSVATLNAIRQTCRAAYELVERQLIVAHNSYTFRDHRRLARVCYLILRRPCELLPHLHTLKIGNLHHSRRRQRDGARIDTCICAELLARVVTQSTALTTMEIQDAQDLLDADESLGPALAASTSLRELCVRSGVGPALMAMFRRMGPGLRKLDINLALRSSDQVDAQEPMVPEALLPALKGARDTLAELAIVSVGRFDALAIEHGNLVWPDVRSIHLIDTHVWHHTHKLVTAFPNLRYLSQSNRTVQEEDTARQRMRRRLMRRSNHAVAMCWPSLDTVSFNPKRLSAAGLTCPVRALRCGYIVTHHDMSNLLEDLPVLKPATFDLGLVMPAVPGLHHDHDAFPPSELTAAHVASIWHNLPWTKTIHVTVTGWGDQLDIEAIDNYMNELQASLRLPRLEFLQLRLLLRYPITAQAKSEHSDSDDTVHGDGSSPAKAFTQSCHGSPYDQSPGGPRRPMTRRPDLREQLAARMTEIQQRALLLVFADANPTLRYVCIKPWDESGFWYWEVLRATGEEGAADALTVRQLSQTDGQRLSAQWENITA